jgi:tetratricopeptide (TPR) repeat protein
MSWRYTLFKKTQIFIQDIVFGASFGILWSGLLGWAIYKFISPSVLIVDLTPWIGGVTGFILGGIASVTFSKTTGSTQEHEKALIAYGKASRLINRIISTVMGMVGGYLYQGSIGLIVGGIIGILIVSLIGDILSLLYFVIFGQAINILANIHGLLRGGPFDKLFSLINILVDIPFKIIELILIKLRIVSKEKLTGITDAREHYDIGIKYDRRNKLKEAIEEYKKAIKLESNFSEAYNNLAYDYGLLGEQDKEISAYREALKLKPDYIKAMRNLAICYIEQGKEDEAKVWLHSLSELQPNIYGTDVDHMVLQIKREMN